MKLSDLGEHRLLARIRDRLPPLRGDVLVGVGDDAAVVAAARNEQMVLTTDALVEGVHFDRRWSSPADVGHKALAVNLSDLAAMGAAPRWALLSLILPDDWPVDAIDALVEGLAALAAAEGLSVIGGNITRTDGPLVVDVTAVGTAAPRRVLRRAGGRPGDAIYVSGTVGGAAAGLAMLRAGTPIDPADADAQACMARHRRPAARGRLGRALARNRAARAAMDTSDGLADALRQLAEASGCGVTVQADALPIDPGARRYWESAGVDAVAAALAGGDDYELLFALPPAWTGRLRHVRRQVAEPAITRIGTLTRDRALWVERGGTRAPLAGGYEHWGQTP